MSSVAEMADDFALALKRYEETVTEGPPEDGTADRDRVAARDALHQCVAVLASAKATNIDELDAKMQVLQRPEAKQFFDEDAYRDLMWRLYLERLFLSF